MKRISCTVLVSILTVTLLAGPARAQFFYSPPPPLMGQPSFHLYSVPGVIALAAPETYFACTNTTSANIRVGIEIFGPPGGAAFNDPSATSLDVAPGATVLFGTNAAVWTVVNSILGGGFSKGSARILATTRSGIICSAFLADAVNFPPTSMTALTIVKKRTQKGD